MDATALESKGGGGGKWGEGGVVSKALSGIGESFQKSESGPGGQWGAGIGGGNASRPKRKTRSSTDISSGPGGASERGEGPSPLSLMGIVVEKARGEQD